MLKLITAYQIDKVMDIYQSVKDDMLQAGLDQWDDVYPNRAVLLNDIEQKELFGYYANDELVACIALNSVQSPEYKAVSWQLNDDLPLVVHRLCVHPENKGQGIAQRIMTYVETYAMKKNYQSIRLDAFQKNPAAVHLYQKVGYDLVGEVTFRKGKFHCFEKLLTPQESSC